MVFTTWSSSKSVCYPFLVECTDLSFLTICSRILPIDLNDLILKGSFINTLLALLIVSSNEGSANLRVLSEIQKVVPMTHLPEFFLIDLNGLVLKGILHKPFIYIVRQCGESDVHPKRL